MAGLIFRHLHRVSYAECTIGNHIYYARYLELLEEARGEFFRELGSSFLNWQQQDTIFPIIECRLRYLAPARYDDCLTIETWVTALEKVRLNFAYSISNQIETRIVEASTFHVCTRLDEKPKRLPEQLVSLLKSYCE